MVLRWFKMVKMAPRWPEIVPLAEGKAEKGSVYRGCMLCPVLCCFEFLWAALDYSGLLWAQGAALKGFGLHCIGMLWAAVNCFGLLWLPWAHVC